MTSESLSDYDATSYPPFAVTADVALFTIRDDALQVLLIERGGEPYRGAWALPGGFVHPDEHLEIAAARELAEETGLTRGAWHLEQLAAYGAPGRDPRMRVVTIAFWAVTADVPLLRGGGDATSPDLVPVAGIEGGATRLAFDHGQIVRDAVDRIRSSLEHTALAAWFCSPKFTIRELRQVYEAVWDTPLDPGNFQRYVRQSGAFRQHAEPTAHESADPRADFDMHPERAMRPQAMRPEHGDVAPRASAMRPEPDAVRPERGRPASLWAARRTADGHPARASRTLARPGRTSRSGGATPTGNP